MFKSLTEKHRTINHMIIFNDSISKFYQYSIQGSCRGISIFLVSASEKNEAIKFLGILKNLQKNTFPRMKYILLKKEKQCFA